MKNKIKHIYEKVLKKLNVESPNKTIVTKTNDKEKASLNTTILVVCLFVMYFAMLVILLVMDNVNLDYNDDKPSITCEENVKINKYLIDHCTADGGEIVITYEKDNEVLRSIACKK